MENLITKYKIHWADKSFVFSALTGVIFLFASLIINYIAGTYATKAASNAVTDIILDNIPVFDVDLIFMNGIVVFVLFMILVMAVEPKRVPFIFKSGALFIFIRAVFVSLTHLAPYPQHVALDFNRITEKIIFGGDLFFSGHTGLPFLMALIFWKNKYLRYIFLAVSLTAGVVVLLGHLHYSIDVLSAFFITYAIYEMARSIFKKDYELLQSG